MSARASTDERNGRPLRLDTTASQRPSTAPQNGAQTVAHHPPQNLDSTPGEQQRGSVVSGYQRFVLTDPVAFRYLEEDPCTTVLERRAQLHGYECYVVEQWTTSRTHPTFVITTFTGDPSHVVVVGVLSVPIDERTWSARLRVYFKALNQYYARRRDTELGILMVTNLSAFPSSLTVIAVPDGDLRKHRFDFFVNEDLKRLGCSGRVGLALTPPAQATIAKFHQLYRTSDANDIYESVIELVKLCQAALTLFDKLEIDYADGLLCDVTERAINDWWVEIGSEHYALEQPHDGILGPTTVAALLGLLMGARNRLHAVGAPVGKDAFDVEAMKRGISHFQKQQRIARTRRLDRPTLQRLHKATQKAAGHTGWAVMPKVLKSTAAELSGKGGEMVMDAVGRGRDRAGIAEIETCDIERFVQLVYGERPKWLWLGKPLKKNRRSVGEARGKNGDVMKGKREDNEGFTIAKGLVFRADERGGFTWSAKGKSISGADIEGGGTGQWNTSGRSGAGRESLDVPGSGARSSRDNDDSETAEDEEARFGVFKRASGLASEAKSGLGKFRGAVGLKGLTNEKNKTSVDEPSPTTPIEDGRKRPLFRRAQSSPASGPNSPTIASSLTEDFSPRQSKETMGRRPVGAGASLNVDAVKVEPQEQRIMDSKQDHILSKRADMNEKSEWRNDEHTPAVDIKDNVQGSGRSYIAPSTADEGKDQSNFTDQAAAGRSSIVESEYPDVQLDEILPTGPETKKDAPLSLRRTVSLSHFFTIRMQPKDSAAPRHLSFSLAEESVLTWADPAGESDDEDEEGSEPFVLLAKQQHKSTHIYALAAAITHLTTHTASWTYDQLANLGSLSDCFADDETTLIEQQRAHSEHVNALQARAESVLRTQRERLEEMGKGLETLVARLDYEIGGLKDRVEDVEQAVMDFEGGVRRVEERVSELEKDGERDGGKRCVMM